MSSSKNSVFPLASVLQQNKLDGTNFADWYRNLKIVLKQQKKEYILEKPVPDVLAGSKNNKKGKINKPKKGKKRARLLLRARAIPSKPKFQLIPLTSCVSIAMAKDTPNTIVRSS